MRRMESAGACAVVLLALAAAVAKEPDSNWPGFRGHEMSGLAASKSLPEKWSAKEGVAWSVEIPGHGWSSPVVWNDLVFITTAAGNKPFKAPSPGIYGNDYAAELQKQGLTMPQIIEKLRARDIESTAEAEELRYTVYALDARTGKIKWEREAHRGAPPGGRHRKNTYASETPFTDGKRLYVSFGQNVGLYCYNMKGKLLWQKQWPTRPIYLDFGTASSPTVSDGKIYLVQDNEEASFLIALDAANGNELWRTEREGPGFKTGFMTPYVWKNSLRTEIVTTGHGLVVSYDLNGKELWRIVKMGQAIPSPVSVNGLLYVGTGAQGDNNRPLFAVKPGASGDISLKPDTTSNEYIVWFHPRATPYTPSPLVYENRVFCVHDTGIMAVLDAQTGKEIYKVRAGGTGNTFSASPVAAAGRVYLLNEEGATFVIDARSSEYKELARNDLGEMSLASPAAAGGALYIRTLTKLYKIGG